MSTCLYKVHSHSHKLPTCDPCCLAVDDNITELPSCTQTRILRSPLLTGSIISMSVRNNTTNIIIIINIIIISSLWNDSVPPVHAWTRPCISPSLIILIIMSLCLISSRPHFFFRSWLKTHLLNIFTLPPCDCVTLSCFWHYNRSSFLTYFLSLSAGLLLALRTHFQCAAGSQQISKETFLWQGDIWRKTARETAQIIYYQIRCYNQDKDEAWQSSRLIRLWTYCVEQFTVWTSAHRLSSSSTAEVTFLSVTN